MSHVATQTRRSGGVVPFLLASLVMGMVGCQELNIADVDEDLVLIPGTPFLGDAEVTVWFALDQSLSMADRATSVENEGRAAAVDFFERLDGATKGWRAGVLSRGPCMEGGPLGPLRNDAGAILYAEASIARETEETWIQVTPKSGLPTLEPDAPIPPGEMLLQRVVDAMDASGPDGCNADMLDEGTTLHVVLVTDAQERSPDDAAAYLSTMQRDVGGDEDSVVVHAVVPATGCGEPPGTDSAGHTELAVETGGLVVDICGDPWTSQLQYVASEVISSLITQP